MRMGLLITVVVVATVACKDKSGGQAEIDQPSAGAGEVAPEPEVPDPEAGDPGPGDGETEDNPFEPESVTVEEVKPLIAIPEGAAVKSDFEAVGPAITMAVCFDSADLPGSAQAAVERLATDGWEYIPPRENTAQKGLVIAARRKPYLLNVFLKPGAEDCGSESAVYAHYFLSKNAASFQ